ncbi:MAG: hypothetical protein AAFR58_18385 [Cyanobacteria bacterium J06627_28]
MDIVKLTAEIDESGRLNLSVPTQLAGTQVNVVIVMNPVEPATRSNLEYDFSDLTGKLAWKGDAVAMQREIRDEW